MSSEQTRTYAHLTPGEMIRHFLDDMGITQYQLAKSTGLPHSRITEVVRGRRGITADTALHLAAAFGNSAEFWMNLQKSHELCVAREKDGDRIQAEVTRLVG
jgi:addiction module HigA family antidote